MDKLIINFTPTGMVPTKAMTPHVPVSVAEIVETEGPAEIRRADGERVALFAWVAHIRINRQAREVRPAGPPALLDVSQADAEVRAALASLRDND